MKSNIGKVDLEKGGSCQFCEKQTGPKPRCAPELLKKYFQGRTEYNAYADINFEVCAANKSFLGHFCRHWNRDSKISKCVEPIA